LLALHEAAGGTRVSSKWQETNVWDECITCYV
jgi:hypothetical protein